MSKVERFLIVDDQEPNLLFFQVLLEELGYSNVYTSNHSSEAETAAARYDVQVIIASWELSGPSGLVLVQRLKSAREHFHVPCLIYSKELKEEEKNLVTELGMKNILSMPFDKTEAKALIEKIIESENNLTSNDIKYRKMVAAHSLNHTDEAIKLADSELLESGIAYKAKTILGEIYMATGAMKKAEEYLNKALEQEPTYLPAKYALAKVYSTSQRHDKAIRLLRDLAVASPLNVKTILNLSSAYLMSGDLESAQNYVQEAEKIDPDCAQLIDEKAKSYLRSGNLEKTKEYIEQSKNCDDLVREFNIMAISLVASGEFEKGIEVYTQAIGLLGEKTKTHLLRFNLGLAYKKQGSLKKAFIEFAKSYIAEPSYEKAYSAIAVVHKEMVRKGIKVGPKAIAKIKAARTKYKTSSGQQIEKAG